jgi:hypothetical protein
MGAALALGKRIGSALGYSSRTETTVLPEDPEAYHTTLLAHSRPEDVQTALGNPLFQQVNARIHTAKIMLAFFKRYAIPLESHPPYSPDLNPIEHAWVLLKRQLIADYPVISNYCYGPEIVKARGSSAPLEEDSTEATCGTEEFDACRV